MNMDLPKKYSSHGTYPFKGTIKQSKNISELYSKPNINIAYSKNSMTRTPMAHLQYTVADSNSFGVPVKYFR